jgi:hypothetical protein
MEIAPHHACAGDDTSVSGLERHSASSLCHDLGDDARVRAGVVLGVFPAKRVATIGLSSYYTRCNLCRG